MPAPRRLPLFGFGNVAHGVIAVGNIAHGVVAIGFTVAVGVVAIGMNAVGAVAIGMNAIGPLTVALINGLGVWGAAGVNLIAGAGVAGVNAGVMPAFGFGVAALLTIIAESVVRSSPPRPAPPARSDLPRAVVVGDRHGERPWLTTGDELIRLEARAFQVAAVAGSALVALAFAR